MNLIDKLILTITLCYLSLPAFAFDNYGTSDFNKYSSQLHEYGTSVSSPRNCRELDMRGRETFFDDIAFMPGVPRDTRYIFGFETNDGQAAFLFPEIQYFPSKKALRNAAEIEKELRAFNRDLKLDIRPLIKIVSQDDMSAYSNADTAIIYEQTLSPEFKSFLNTYNHYVGVYLRKKGHPALLLKIMLTDEGMKHKEEYISALLASVTYDDNETSLSYYENQLKQSEIDFPTLIIGYSGILPNVSKEALDALNEYYYHNKQVIQREDSIRRASADQAR